MNYIKVEEGMYLREDLIGAIRILTHVEMGKVKVAIRYYSTSGKEFTTDWVDDLEELLVCLPMDVREDLIKNKGDKK